MDVVFTHCAGVDVHQQTVMACRVRPDPLGPQADGRLEGRACGTLTCDVLAWSDGLTEAGSPPVAMASTGASWQPVDHLLDGPCTVFLVNAAQGKNVPGRQTEGAEARWLAQRLREGVRPASFLPPMEQRDLRDRPRYRTQLGPEQTRASNRVPGVLERANSQRASVATDLMGGSGRALLAALLAGRAAPAPMAALAQGRWRRTMPGVEQALTAP